MKIVPAYIRFLGFYLLLAAIGKTLSPERMYKVLEFDGFVDPSIQKALVISLVLIESGIAMMALTRPSHINTIRFVGGLFAGFIFQLFLLQIGKGPTLCGCMGQLVWLFPEFRIGTGLMINIGIVIGCWASIHYTRKSNDLAQPISITA